MGINLVFSKLSSLNPLIVAERAESNLFVDSYLYKIVTFLTRYIYL